MRTIAQVYSTISEGSRRELKGAPAKLTTIFAIAYSLYHLWVFVYGAGKLNLFQHRSTHLLLILSLAFLVYSSTKKKQGRIPVIDIILALMPLAILAYMFINLRRITLWLSLIDSVSPLDIIFGTVLILLILEGARRVAGMPLVIVTLVFLAYMFFGQHLGGLWWHYELPFYRVIDILFLSTEGLWGPLMGISSTYIILFVIFGQLMLQCGGATFFVDIANAIAGGGRGGPAKVAVVASALFGTVSGSQVANVATTGSFTIPMMKKMGFKPAFAGGVELSASMGGMIMPPVMAATVFLMSEIAGIPYVTIIIAAFIPACLYFFAVFWQVHLESIKLGIGKIPKEERPSPWKVLKEGGQFLAPLVIIIVILMMGYTPIRAALWAIGAVLAAALVRKETRKNFISSVLKGLEDGAKTSIMVVLAIAAGAIMVGVVLPTGLGGKFGSMVMLFAGGNLIPVLIIAMLASLVLGAPLSVAATYILTAIMIVPVTVGMGVPPMAAHLFAIYFAVIAPMSPPAGPAMFLAGGMAGADPMRVGFIGMRLAIGIFILPFMFVLNPALLLMGTPLQIIAAVITAAVALFALATGFEGWLVIKTTWWERVFLFVGGLLLVFPGALTLSLGGGAVAAGFILHLMRARFVTKTL